MNEPEDFMCRFLPLILSPGRAPKVLDVACGRGRHALYMARKGCSVVAMDRSHENLNMIDESARREGLPILTCLSDVERMSLLGETVDSIVNTFFLWRPLAAEYSRALRPGGVLYFRTFTTDHVDRLGHTQPRRDFLLTPGELGRMFPDLDMLHYEEAIVDKRALATLVGRK